MPHRNSGDFAYFHHVKTGKLNIIIVLGLVAIIGILIAQLLWTREAFNLEQKKFSQRVHIALLEVVKRLYEGTSHELPSENPVQKIANDYYIVNVENDFDPKILEFYLTTEFQKANLNTDFEYAMYNCQSDEMVYGNYVSLHPGKDQPPSVYFPKHENLVYYFAVRFPNENAMLFSSLRFWFALSAALAIILIVYVYSIVTIIQQRRYSELQRDFINNMTHEFKTPLSSILIAADFLQKQPEIAANDKLSRYAGIIINQSNKLNNHVGKILDTAKSDTDLMVPDLKEASLNNLIADVVDNITLKHESVEVTVAADREFIVRADEFHLTNVVYNLLDNAIKYCHSEPKIAISIAERGGVIQLDFADNGIGVPAKDMRHIFDKFYRAQQPQAAAVTGFGLGLYYVAKVCRMHRWKISAADNAGGGLRISIQIPKP